MATVDVVYDYTLLYMKFWKYSRKPL